MRVALQVQADTYDFDKKCILIYMGTRMLTIPEQTRPGLTLRLALENSSAGYEDHQTGV